MKLTINRDYRVTGDLAPLYMRYDGQQSSQPAYIEEALADLRRREMEAKK